MKRRIIQIDETLCNGCGACATACHEGAIAMIDGKAKLIRDDYCDGLGNCLPVCPTNAITLEEREAAAYDEEAVQKHLNIKKMIAEMKEQKGQKPTEFAGCPGQKVQNIRNRQSEPSASDSSASTSDNTACTPSPSQLGQWPVQIKLVPVNAPYFENADLLIAADCTAYAYGDFHNRFIKNRITLIGCPKLDEGDYTEKLTAIIKNNSIKSLTIVRMEVPCCGGIERASTEALKSSGKFIPWQVVTIGIDGNLVE